MKYIDPAVHGDSAPNVHPSQRQAHVKPVSSPLYVVTTIFNPKRYASRYRLYRAFEKMCHDAGVRLYTVELALRDRHFEISDPQRSFSVTRPDDPCHIQCTCTMDKCGQPTNYIQLRSPQELFYKENLTNIGIGRLPSDWEYVAWIDADVAFARPDWAVETIHQLQHYKVVQMFANAIDVGPDYQLLETYTGFMYQYLTGGKPQIGNPLFWNAKNDSMKGSCGYGYPPELPLYHPGYAWAARRSAVSDLGGLGDIAILGSGDHHMAAALIGNVDSTYPKNVEESYKEYWRKWQERAERHVKRNVGFVPGTLTHYWHGSKKNRQYVTKWGIYTQFDYEWQLDLKYDVQGLLQWTERNPPLHYAVREYFAVRNEDSIDL